jgi:hypothetical protein
MITRAQVEEELSKFGTQEEQYRAVEILLRNELPASPVVNGPLQQFMDSEGIGLIDVILADLPSYQNWIVDERQTSEE